MSLELRDAENKREWDDFVANRPESNFLQSWDFYEFHKNRGEEIVRRIALKNGKIVGAYAGEVEHAKRGRHMAIAGGPILDWKDKNVREAIFKDIKDQGEKLNCVFVRVRPQCENTPENIEIFRKNGFKKAPMYLSVEYAGILDLNKSEEEIMVGMRQRLRRALRKAAKNNIIVEKSTDPKDIHTFYEIQLQTAKRHDFYAFSEDFLTKQFEAFAPNGEAVLYTAKISDEKKKELGAENESNILAQNFMIFYGNEASYHYGVSSELGTKLSGAPLLHMEAMKDARGRGIKRYNFWGIVGENETKHRFYGVSVFKRGFGVTELKYLPAQDLILKPFEYYTKTWLIETVRKKVRHV
ncbi:peptidoglycan bridge formation glycyltransferase FemA/FemB family protein [Candidatus Saccharibacteria bacterium]|nr:peptidoglycan bridge formation glycyltransferase FemA/FemB family protein [Candidatus Saccharibacteria bacterium]